MGKTAGIDYGRARIGVAFSDLMGMLASPRDPIKAEGSPEKSGELVARALSEAEAFVVGLPLHMSGKESELSLEARRFASALEEHSGKKVILWDERLSSAGADRLMKEQGGLSRKRRAAKIDSMSATLLLQSYLDSK